MVLNAFTRRISEIERQRAELQVEEDRVFDFLHGLGEAFSEGVRSSELHRLIVEGATRILDAHGGALYLMDKADAVLVPAFMSKGCPALLHVPSHILDQAATNHLALESYLRLSPVRRGDGILGRVWETGQTRLYSEMELAGELSPNNLNAHSALVGPLVYRRKILGVLGLANGPLSTPFTEKDITVFKTIAEQSAFALYNEAIYLEAGEKKRMDHDLEIAREIQAILLPSSPPIVEGYQLSGLNVPGTAGQRRLLRLHPGGRAPHGRGHRRRLGEGRAGLADHGHVSQRHPQRGGWENLRFGGPAPGQPAALSRHQRRTCSSAWPTSSSTAVRIRSRWPGPDTMRPLWYQAGRQERGKGHAQGHGSRH